MSIILYLLKEQRISQKELCERIGIKQQVFTDWKAGRNKSYSKYLSQIANCLNVSVDHLLGKEHSLHITPSQKSQNDIDTVIESIRLDGITAMCPVYDSVSAGYGALAEDCIIGYMPTFVTSNEEAKYLFWVNVKGIVCSLK